MSDVIPHVHDGKARWNFEKASAIVKKKG